MPILPIMRVYQHIPRALMIDSELEKIVGKRLKLRALRRAWEQVRQLERELNGEPARPEEPPPIPEFLRQDMRLRVAK